MIFTSLFYLITNDAHAQACFDLRPQIFDSGLKITSGDDNNSNNGQAHYVNPGEIVNYRINYDKSTGEEWNIEGGEIVQINGIGINDPNFKNNFNTQYGGSIEVSSSRVLIKKFEQNILCFPIPICEDYANASVNGILNPISVKIKWKANSLMKINIAAKRLSSNGICTDKTCGVEVYYKNLPASAPASSSTTINCNENFIVSATTSFYNPTGYGFNWSCAGASNISYSGVNNTTAVFSFGSFISSYVVNLEIIEFKTNRKAYYSYNVNIRNPFVTPLQVQINKTSTYATRGTVFTYVPTCDQAYGNYNTTTRPISSTNATRFDAPQYPSGAVYTWQIPKGWTIPRPTGTLVPLPTVDVNGISTYTGTYAQLGSIELRSTISSVFRGEGIIEGGQVSLQVATCSQSQNILINIRPHTALDIQLPNDIITCQTGVVLKGVVKTDGNSPNYTVDWTTSGGTLLEPVSASNYSQNSFTGANGSCFVRAKITDDRCVSDLTQSNITLGSATAQMGAWNSGILSDDRSIEVQGNVQYTSGGGENIIVPATLKGTTDMGIYFFQYGFGWIPKDPLLDPLAYKQAAKNTTAATPGLKMKQGTNSILSVPNSANFATFYIGVHSTSLTGDHVRYIEKANQQISATAGNTHNDVVELFDYVPNFQPRFSSVYYRRANGYLGYYDGAAGTSNDFVTTATKFDVTINDNKVFYIDNAGALWYKPAGTSNNTPNNVLIIASNTFAPYTGNTTGYTDLVFDNSGNLYYVRAGALYVRLKAESFATERATVTSTATLTGSFTINKNTGTLYCIATNRCVYQFFPSSGIPVTATTTWGTKKATVSSTSGSSTDKAGTYPIFAGEHLFYVSTTTTSAPRQDWAAKTVFNLYFTDACTPNPYRVGVTDNDVMDKEQADYETGMAATVFPNPFTNEITLDMAGEGEAEIKLYNSIGKVMRTQAYSFGAVTLATEELKEGLYTLAVYQNGKRLVAKKVVK